MIIGTRRLAQAEAARRLGVDQPKVSALIRGRLQGFSIDRLLRFLVALDRDIEIVVKPKRRGLSTGRVKVVAVGCSSSREGWGERAKGARASAATGPLCRGGERSRDHRRRSPGLRC